MSDYIKRQDVLDIIHKEIESTTTYIEHHTQINIKFAVEELPTISEAEIIRKAFERVVERLEEFTEQTYYKSVEGDVYAGERNKAYHNAIEIIKEECGISE